MSTTLAQTRREDLTAPKGGSRDEPSLYVVLEGDRISAGGLRVPLVGVDELRINRGATRSFRLEEGRKATLEVPDARMSGKHARLVREDAGWLFEDVGSTNGSFVEGKRVTQTAIDESAVITLGATCFLFDPAEVIPEGAPAVAVDSASLRSRPRGMATLVPSVEATMPRLVRVAMSKLSILLLGESGAGKEVLARTVHKLSARPGPFVAISCGALAPTLVESQLFGYVKGAFSGALKDEPGLIRASSGGTLFLDEVGELTPSAQATLLRVLQEKEVLPIGSTKPVPVDLRVVAATLKPIDQSPMFREDLYARISAFVHRLAPLRERRGDLGILAGDLLTHIAPERAPKVRIAADLGTALVGHDYPLNVRELEHVLSVALVTTSEDILRLESIGDALKSARRATPSSPPDAEPAARQTGARAAVRPTPAAPAKVLSDDDQRLKADLVEALSRTHGNVSEIARTMGKTRMQIHRWMKRFALDPESFRS